MNSDDDTPEELVQKIIRGDDVKLYPYGVFHNYIEELCEQLKVHTDNANCMLYAAKCLPRKLRREYLESAGAECLPKRFRREYLERSCALGNRDAIFYCGYRQYKSGDKVALSMGLKAFRAGFRFINYKPYQHEYEVQSDSPACRDYYDLVLLEHIKELETTLEQERLRPPEVGGSEYMKAKEHYTSLSFL